MASDAKVTFNQEVRALAALRHPNVILMLGVSDSPPIIVLPYMQKGSLQSMIDKEIVVSLSHKLKYLVDAAKGTDFKITFRFSC
jgi:serine/threonine protein kinase